MKIAYILFTAAIDSLLYITLYTKINKNRKIGPALWWLWAAAALIIICHADIFKLRFLLPFDDLLMALYGVLAVAIANLLTKFYRERTQKSNFFGRQIKRIVIVNTYFAEVVLYAAIFFFQCVIIFYAVERYYK
jgi:hypothetical protein